MNDLSKAHYQLLKLFSKRNSLSAEDVAAIYDGNWVTAFKLISYLEGCGYVHKLSFPEDADSRTAQYAIEPDGILAVSGYRKQVFKSVVLEIRDWLTLIVALVTLVITWLTYSHQYL